MSADGVPEGMNPDHRRTAMVPASAGYPGRRTGGKMKKSERFLALSTDTTDFLRLSGQRTPTR
ncbi:MAG: hypothetical protein Q8Q73_09995 [Stagnimonas sp.]|nr:hypothetical protein [Stagnimonas sp.]